MEARAGYHALGPRPASQRATRDDEGLSGYAQGTIWQVVAAVVAVVRRLCRRPAEWLTAVDVRFLLTTYLNTSLRYMHGARKVCGERKLHHNEPLPESEKLESEV